MRVIYADSVFLLNFTIDYLLLLATGKICTLPLRRGRMALGAVWGGVYALCSTLWPEFFALATLKILSGLACAAIAYGGKGRFPRTAVVFFAVSAAFGGTLYALAGLGGGSLENGAILGLSSRTLILSFAICYAALSLVFRGMGRRSEREVKEVELKLRGSTVSFTALQDTGNELLDTAGRPVLTARWSAVAPLFPELPRPPVDPTELCLALDALEGMSGRCRVMSCATVTSGGLLAAFRPDKILIGGKSTAHALVAISFARIGADGDYQALI